MNRIQKTELELSRTVEEYWNAKISRDWNVIKRIESGANEEETAESLTQRALFNIDIKSFRIENISFKEDLTKAEVKVEFTYTIPILPDELHKTDISEWILKKGKWYFKTPVKGLIKDNSRDDAQD